MSENSADQIRIPLKVLASTLIILGILVIGAGVATYVIPAAVLGPFIARSPVPGHGGSGNPLSCPVRAQN